MDDGVRLPGLIHLSAGRSSCIYECDAGRVGWLVLLSNPGRRLRLELLEQEARALEQAVRFARIQFERTVGGPIPVLDRVHRRLRILLGELDPE